MDAAAIAALRKKRKFHKFQFRGVELEQLLELNTEELMNIVHSRARRRMKRGLKQKAMGLIKRIREAKKNAGPLERPKPIKTHLRDMIIVPEMIHSQLAVYNGKEFNLFQVMPEMVGYYLGEFSITYRPVRHGRPGIGSTNSSRFIPLK
jgi:small subunit ribosomal protein S15e